MATIYLLPEQPLLCNSPMQLHWQLHLSNSLSKVIKTKKKEICSAAYYFSAVFQQLNRKLFVLPIKTLGEVVKVNFFKAEHQLLVTLTLLHNPLRTCDLYLMPHHKVSDLCVPNLHSAAEESGCTLSTLFCLQYLSCFCFEMLSDSLWLM